MRLRRRALMLMKPKRLRRGAGLVAAAPKGFELVRAAPAQSCSGSAPCRSRCLGSSMMAHGRNAGPGGDVERLRWRRSSLMLHDARCRLRRRCRGWGMDDDGDAARRDGQRRCMPAIALQPSDVVGDRQRPGRAPSVADSADFMLSIETGMPSARSTSGWHRPSGCFKLVVRGDRLGPPLVGPGGLRRCMSMMLGALGDQLPRLRWRLVGVRAELSAVGKGAWRERSGRPRGCRTGRASVRSRRAWLDSRLRRALKARHRAVALRGRRGGVC